MRLDSRKAHNIDQLFTVDGDPADASGPVAVVVTRDDGTELDTIASAERISEGVYRYALAPQATLDRLTFTYTGTWSGEEQTDQQVHDLVGGHYFTEAEARAVDPSFIEAAYGDEDIRQARDVVEDALEGICGRAFVRRFHSEIRDGDGSCELLLAHLFPRKVIRLSVAGSALSGPELDALILDSSGEVSRLAWRFSAGRGNVAVAYEYGEDRPPAIIKRAALLLFKAWLPALHEADSGPSFAGARSVRLDGVGITYGETTTGVSTGIDAVDRLITTWLGNRPVVA
jgi:hypothetical protein